MWDLDSVLSFAIPTHIFFITKSQGFEALATIFDIDIINLISHLELRVHLADVANS